MVHGDLYHRHLRHRHDFAEQRDTKKAINRICPRNERVDYRKYAELLEKNLELEKRIRELKPVGIEAAYENYQQKLYDVLVSNLVSRSISKESEQEVVEKFLRGLETATRAKNLALNATSAGLPAKTAQRIPIKKK